MLDQCSISLRHEVPVNPEIFTHLPLQTPQGWGANMIQTGPWLGSDIRLVDTPPPCRSLPPDAVTMSRPHGVQSSPVNPIRLPHVPLIRLLPLKAFHSAAIAPA
jgi:hypothetical protein